MLNNFDVNIWDVESRIVKPKTIIGDRAYCEGTAGKEFWVVVRVLDMAMHKKLNPTGELNVGVSVDGKQLDFSQSFLQGASEVIFKDISGGRALTFTRPEQQWFNDIEDAKRAKEENKKSKVGVIEVIFRQCQRTGEISHHSGSAGVGNDECKVKATKKFFDQPNVGIAGGRVISQAATTSAKVHTLTTFGKLEVYCQSALAIKMLKAQHDGVDFDADPEEPEQEEEVPAVPAPAPIKEDPVVKNEAGASSSSSSAAAGKKRASIEIDLTNDDSDSDSDDDADAAPPAAAAAAEADTDANKRAKSSDFDLDFTK